MAMRLFEQYFELPLQLDIWGEYVFDNNYSMVIQFHPSKDGIHFIKAQEQVVDWINGYDTVKPKVGLLEYDANTSSITNDNHPWIELRGWGHLTGTGGLNLSDKEATEIQDSLAEYIIEKLNG